MVEVNSVSYIGISDSNLFILITFVFPLRFLKSLSLHCIFANPDRM